MKHEYEVKLGDINSINSKLNKDIKSSRKKCKMLEIENIEYKDIFDDMKNYLQLVRNAHSYMSNQ